MITQPQFKGTIYPDRSFSLGFCPKEKKRKAEREYDRDYATQAETDTNALIDWYTGITSIEGKFCSIDAKPLLVKAPKSSQEKRGVYGRKGITNFGKRFIKNACLLLQDIYGKSRLGFATCTLPSMDRGTCDTINGRLSDITRRFYQKIRRKYKKRGSEFIYVGCVEIQEKRFKSSCIPAPHLHFVYLAKDSLRARYTCSTEDFYTAWNESVNEVLKLVGKPPLMGTCGHTGSVKLERIRTSAAAYMGKYLSKGCKVVEAMREQGFEKFPKQWWTASMQMKKLFRASLIRMDANFAACLFDQLEYFLHEEMVTWARYVDALIGGEVRTVGLVGKFSPDAYNKIKQTNYA